MNLTNNNNNIEKHIVNVYCKEKKNIVDTVDDILLILSNVDAKSFFQR